MWSHFTSRIFSTNVNCYLLQDNVIGGEPGGGDVYGGNYAGHAARGRAPLPPHLPARTAAHQPCAGMYLDLIEPVAFRVVG